MADRPGRPRPRAARSGLESTASLLSRARRGDASARDKLLSRYRPAFRRWASGRLPPFLRGPIDTDDLVQQTFVRALKHMDGFESRREGAFLAYLRQILENQIRDHIRHAARRPAPVQLSELLPDVRPSVLDDMIQEELLQAYEAALQQLPEKQRQAFVMRIELGFAHEEVAAAIGSRSRDAARMHVVRALVRMAELMREHRSAAGGTP